MLYRYTRACFWVCLINALRLTSYSGATDDETRFDLGDSLYDCTPNTGKLICLGTAHRYTGNRNGSYNGNSDGSFAGKLSLIQEIDEDQPRDPEGGAGIGYYNKRVRMLDPSSGRSASFSTSFAFAAISMDWNYTSKENTKPLDGMTFVVSADNSIIGGPNRHLGFFRETGNLQDEEYTVDGTNSFKSVVVEFDTWQHTEGIWNDINNNHVSFDIQNVTAVTSQNAENVEVYLWKPDTHYAWVEYSAQTQRLELRLSNVNNRPISPLLFFKVDLFDVVDEYMWVGFSGSVGTYYGNFYIWNWTFFSSFAPITKPYQHSKGKRNYGFMVGIPVSIAAMLGTLVGACFLGRRLGKGAQSQLLRPNNWDEMNDPALQFACEAKAYRFTYRQLNVATGGFREQSILGRGGFGTVYGGVLAQSGTEIAVKKIKTESKQPRGERAFVAEVSIITQLRHRNLIQLLGWCMDRGHLMIVYELMPKGSLDMVLFQSDEKHPPLSWLQRFNVICGTADAVDYLHRSWNRKVIHRDIKVSNIMLDHDWNAKLGDFGLARLVDHQVTPSTTAAAGTMGYMAPEAASGKFTEKTDIFAFGIVVLEIATGRKCVAFYLPEEEIVLVDWVRKHLNEGDLLSVVDSRLGEYDAHRMAVVLRVGLLCAHIDPSARPSMRKVVQMLAGDAEVPSITNSKPAAPAFSLELSTRGSVNDLESGSYSIIE